MQPRLITLTLNPALDLAADADAVVPTHKIRMHHEHADPGGGGVNVARVLHELGGDTLAILAASGAPGRVLEALLDEAGVRRRSVLIRGRTRISLNVQDASTGLEYRFVPEGPTLTTAEFQACLATIEQEPGEWLIASGSLPNGVPDDTYAQVARIAAGKGQRFVLDTSGAALVAALEQGGCELVKPSLGELEHLVGRPLKGQVEQDWHAMALVRRGATRMGGAYARGGGRPVGHPGRCDPDAGHGCSDAQLGRCGRRVSGSDKVSPWRSGRRRRKRWRGAPPREPLPSLVPVRLGCGVSTWRRDSGNCAAMRCRGPTRPPPSAASRQAPELLLVPELADSRAHRGMQIAQLLY